MSRILRPKPVALLALKRAAIYFLCLDFLAFFYYGVGNGQGFVVDTQLMLLRAVSLLSAAAFLSALAGGAASVVLWVRRVLDFSVSALLGWTVCAAASAALAFFSSAVRVFSSGM